MIAKLFLTSKQVQAGEGGGGASARGDAARLEGEADQGAVDAARPVVGVPRGRRGRLGRLGRGTQRAQEQIQAEERSELDSISMLYFN